MRRAMMLCAAVLCLTMTLAPTALAAGADEVEVCYPTAITQSEDGTELRKLYDLGPEDDPTGIPRSDFEQDGFHYTLTDLLRQELPEHDERQHTETVSLQSANKDMASILALLPQEKEFITEDGYMGTLSLQLDTVQVEVSGPGDLRHQVLSQPGQSGHFQHPQDHPGQWTDPDPPDHQLADGQHSNPGRLRPG